MKVGILLCARVGHQLSERKGTVQTACVFCKMEDEVVEISSDNDSIQLCRSNTASPGPSCVSVFTPTKREPSPYFSGCVAPF